MAATYTLGEEQLAVQELVRRVAREKVAPRAQEIDRTAEYPHDMFELLRELGLFTLPFPAEYGGTGSMLSACIAVEELGRVCYNTGLPAGRPVDAVRRHPGRRHRGAEAAPAAGPRVRRAARRADRRHRAAERLRRRRHHDARARRAAGGYRSTARRSGAPTQPIADFILVAAKTRDERRAAGINLFIVERGTPGLDVGRKEDKIGARGVPSSALFFDDAFVPDERPARRAEGRRLQAS